DVDIRGLEIDSLVGTADLHDFTINMEDEEMSLQQVHLFSEKEGKNRFVKLETTLFDALIEGDYLFTDLTLDLDRLVREMAMNVRNNDAEIRKYYQTSRPRPRNYKATFEFNIKDVKPLNELLALDIDLSENTLIEGNFTSGYTTIFRAFTKLDTLNYHKNLLLDSEAELTVSKIADSTNVLAVGYLSS